MGKISYEGVKWVWFDLDDTLCDFHASSDMALDDVFRLYDLGRFFRDADTWATVYHRHNSALWELYNRADIDKATLKHDRFALPLAEAGTPTTEIDRLVPSLDRDYLKRLAANCRPIDGAVGLLENLRAHGKLTGIISNGFVEVQYDKIAACGFNGLIDCVVLSDEIGVNKPDSRLFAHAASKSGATAGDSLLIGDNPSTDIAGAVNAGWRAVLYRPDHVDADTAAPSCPVISSLGEAMID